MLSCWLTCDESRRLTQHSSFRSLITEAPVMWKSSSIRRSVSFTDYNSSWNGTLNRSQALDHRVQEDRDSRKNPRVWKLVKEFCSTSPCHRFSAVLGFIHLVDSVLWICEHTTVKGVVLAVLGFKVTTSRWHDPAFVGESADVFFFPVNHFQTLSVWHLALVWQHVIWFVEDRGAFSLTTGLQSCGQTSCLGEMQEVDFTARNSFMLHKDVSGFLQTHPGPIC